MPVEDIIWNLIANDKASAKLLKASLAFGVIGLAVEKFAKDSVKQYELSEAAQTRLTFAYDKFPKAADVTLSSMIKLSEATQQKTIYDHEATQSAEALLLRFNLTGDQIEKLIPLVQDYASAQGIDLVDAATNVGKALEGNARALKAIGINFHATGDTAKDYATIQADLTDKVGGFAEKQGKDAASQAIIMQHNFADLEVQVGSLLVPAMLALVGVVNPMVKDFNALPPPVKDAALAFGALVLTTTLVVPRIAAAKAGLETLGWTAGSLKGKLAGSAGLIAGITLLGFALSKMGDDSQQATGLVDAFASGSTNDKLKALADQLGEFPDAYSRTWKNSIQSMTHSTDVLKQLGVSVGDVQAHLDLSEPSWQKYRQTLLDASDAAGNNGSTTGLLADNLDRARSAQQAVDKATRDAIPPIVSATDAVSLYNASLVQHTKDLWAGVKGLEGQKLAAYDAADADAAAKKAIKDLGKGTHESSQVVRDSMRTIITAASDAAAKYTDAGKSNHAYLGELEHLRAKTAPGSALRKALDAYIAQVEKLNRTVTTNVKINLNGHTMTTSQATAYLSKTHGNAAGGYEHFASGGFTWGEYGTEAADIRGGVMRIYSAPQTQAMDKGMSNQRPIQVNLVVAGQTLAGVLLKIQRDGTPILLPT